VGFVDSGLSFVCYAYVWDVEVDATVRSNQSLEPTAGRRDAPVDFTKEFSMFATLALASRGSACSR